MTYIVKNEHGAFCSVCQSQLSIEEEDFDTCDACGGEGMAVVLGSGVVKTRDDDNTNVVGGHDDQR